MERESRFAVTLLQGGLYVWQPNKERFERKATQAFSILVLLIARATSLGNKGVLTSEITNFLCVGNAPRKLHELTYWRPDCYRNESPGGEGSYICQLPDEEVDVLHLAERARHYLEHGIEAADFPTVRSLLDHYSHDPYYAFPEQHIRDKENDPFAEFKELMREFFLRAEAAAEPPAAEIIRIRYSSAFGQGFPKSAGRNNRGSAALTMRSRVASAVDLTNALSEIGAEDVIGDLAGSFLDPEFLLNAVEESLDFLGHTASKPRRSSNLRPFLKRLAAKKGDGIGPLVRFLLSDRACAGQPRRELEELVKTYRGVLEVRFYTTRPLFRLTHVDKSWIAVQTYPQGEIIPGESYGRGAIIFGRNGPESYYPAFREYFQRLWLDSQDRRRG